MLQETDTMPSGLDRTDFNSRGTIMLGIMLRKFNACLSYGILDIPDRLGTLLRPPIRPGTSPDPALSTCDPSRA